jgi:hypothetical protein
MTRNGLRQLSPASALHFLRTPLAIGTIKSLPPGRLSEAPISESSGSSPAVAGRKNSQLAAARRVALKMGRLGETYRRVGVSAFRRLAMRDAVGLRSRATGVARLETSLC